MLSNPKFYHPRIISVTFSFLYLMTSCMKSINRFIRYLQIHSILKIFFVHTRTLNKDYFKYVFNVKSDLLIQPFNILKQINTALVLFLEDIFPPDLNMFNEVFNLSNNQNRYIEKSTHTPYSVLKQILTTFKCLLWKEDKRHNNKSLILELI